MTSTMKKQTTVKSNSIFKRAFAQLQKLGKSLLFPIAMLPMAAIFLRLGAAIPGDTEFSKAVSDVFMTIGNGVFGDAMPFLFAIGIAFGMSKDQRGEAAIVGFSVMIIMTIMLSRTDNVAAIDTNITNAHTFQGVFGSVDIVDKIYHGMTLNGGSGFSGLFLGGKYNAILANNVFTGIFAGSLVAYIYNRFNGIELPSVLGFFSGRRLVPVMALMTTAFAGILYAIVFPWFGAGIYYIGKGMGEAQGSHWGNAGVMGAFGIMNRLLIPFGLHHVINTPLWFTSVGGDWGGKAGDLNIFAGAPAALYDAKGVITSINPSGTFQSGFFPVMMFGLPALAAAIWFNAKGEGQKAKVASLFAGSALVSFFTGITEPIEFSFMFLAPALYGLHAILTGLIGFVVGAFGIQLGFGFSAGLIDYVLSIPKSVDIASAISETKGSFAGTMANPGWIWVIGAGTAAAYFFSANFMIKKLNLNTPGRGTNLMGETSEGGKQQVAGGSTARAQKYVKALGGYGNITNYAHCATRLRYDIVDPSKVDDKALQAAGAFGVAHPSKTHVQVIVGPTVEIVNNEILAGKPADLKVAAPVKAAAKPTVKKTTTVAAKPAVKKAPAKKATTATKKAPAKKPAAKTKK